MAATRPTLNAAQRNALINNLVSQGYNTNFLAGQSNDELLGLSGTAGSRAFERSERAKDRTETLADFRAQLADLTGSKQRQAEQAGRIARAQVQAQGLGQMMSNF